MRTHCRSNKFLGIRPVRMTRCRTDHYAGAFAVADGRSFASLSTATLALAIVCALPTWAWSQIPEVKYNLLETSNAQVANRGLHRETSFSWTNQGLRDGLATLSTTFKTSIWLDRRLDPNSSITYLPAKATGFDGSLLGRLSEVAEPLRAEVGVIENVVYIGPQSSTQRAQRAAVQLHDAISMQDQQLGGQSRLLKWPELATPQSVLEIIESDWKITIHGELPHDLLHEGQLQAATSLATQLTLLVAGFELEVKLVGKRTFELAPLGNEVRWQANYAKAAIAPSELGSLRDKFPSGKLRQNRAGYSVLGPTNFHSQLLAARGRDKRQVASGRAWTLEVKDPTPTEAIIDQLAASLGVQVEWDAGCTAEQRATRQRLKIVEASTDELLRQICDGANLEFKLDDTMLNLKSK